MLGTILGDIIGSPYQYSHNAIKDKEFVLFKECSHYTDDTVMALAISEAFIKGYQDEKKSYNEAIKSMQYFGRHYTNAGYGGNFYKWICSMDPKPYQSYGNGSAMRVTSIAYLYENIDNVQKFADISARPTHNHVEGLKGACSIASAIYLARHKVDKKIIKKYIKEKYGYKLDKTCDEIRTYNTFDISCQKTVPFALQCFFEGNSFEECIRLAISLGGDSDTIGAMAGAIAEPYYGIPNGYKEEACSRMDKFLTGKLEDFYKFVNDKEKSRKENIERTILLSEDYKNNKEEIINYILSDDMIDNNYIKTFNLYDFFLVLSDKNNIIKNSDPFLIKAILTCIIKQNKYIDGYLDSALECGLIKELLISYKSKMFA